jgi:hypothetical protein
MQKVKWCIPLQVGYLRRAMLLLPTELAIAKNLVYVMEHHGMHEEAHVLLSDLIHR